MKDEEMAEEYIEKNCKIWEEGELTVDEIVRLTFLAGLKAGRPQWHDLRENPNDLPPKMDSNHNFSIEVLTDKGEIVRYNFHYCEWFYWRSGEPIAWCELPTFDKE